MPFGSGWADAIGSVVQWGINEEVRKKNDARWNRGIQIMDEYGQHARDDTKKFTDGMTERYDEYATKAGADWKAFEDRQNTEMGQRYGHMKGYQEQTRQGMEAFRQQSDDAYGSRSDRVMGRIEQMGGQERKDINRQYDDMGSQQEAAMSARGMSGTTIMPSMKKGIERDRRDAQGRLDDRLRQNLTDADMSMSSARLNSRSDLFQYGEQLNQGNQMALDSVYGQNIGMRSDLAQYGTSQDAANHMAANQAAGQYGQMNLDLDYKLSTDMANRFQSRVDTPGMNPFSMYGQAMYRPPQPNEDNSAAYISGGVGAAAAVGAMFI